MKIVYLGLALILITLTGCVPEKTVFDNKTIKEIKNATTTTQLVVSDWQVPLDRVSERVTKKFFATKVSPTDSPVQPEKFSGYHTGVDFETFTDEAEKVVQVNVVCSGKILQRRTASGYGGLVVQACVYGNQPVTVVYGHLDITSVTMKIGETLSVGEKLGNLGKGYSTQTDGERKHLHLGIHQGNAVSILGYVNKHSELAYWIDPLTIFKR